MKTRKNVKNRIVTFATVKTGSECFLDGVRVVKVRPKVGMTSKGKIMTLPDFTQVRIKI